MDSIIVISILMRGVATVWSVVLWRQVRDSRMLFPTLVLTLMTLEQALPITSGAPLVGETGPISAHALVEFVIGVGALISVPMLARMIAARRSVVAETEQREANMRQILDLVPHMIFAKDWNSRFLLANKSMALAYGKTVDDLLGAPQKEFQLSEAELEHFLADDREVMSSGQPKFIPEEPFTDSDGRLRIVETTKIPFTAPGSTEPAMLGIAVDITDRKRAEQRLQLTLRELDHRVKNILALVQAVAEHAAATTDSVESFVTDFRARTMAMARMHEALRRKHWDGAELRELVELAVAPYRRDNECVRYAGPDVLIPARQVQALGMALHELAANAAKYGAGADRGGRIDINWDIENTNGTARLRIVWEESGGPSVSRPAKRGLGMSLIEDGVPYEIGGEASVRFDPNGVCAEILIPLEDVAGLSLQS